VRRGDEGTGCARIGAGRNVDKSDVRGTKGDFKKTEKSSLSKMMTAEGESKKELKLMGING